MKMKKLKIEIRDLEKMGNSKDIESEKQRI